MEKEGENFSLEVHPAFYLKFGLTGQGSVVFDGWVSFAVEWCVMLGKMNWSSLMHGSRRMVS